MNSRVPRTVSPASSPDNDAAAQREGLALADFDSDRGYVLLGEPGLGKTTEFRAEAERADGIFLTTREFLRGNPARRPEWRDRTLFIDGLDELRAAAGDPRTPLDQVVEKLEALGTPAFRLACRTSSWLEPGDERELSSVTGTGTIRTLTLNPLSRDDVRRLVSGRRDDAEEFIFEAQEHGLEAFLWNPQLLGVLLDAVETDGWPDSPRAAFENACREIAKERNPEHRDARRARTQPSRDAVLLAAGQLCALLLLTGKQGWTAADTDDPDILSLCDVDDDVDGEDRDALLAALDSRLFAGVSSARTPVHRLISEFLGARYVDGRIRTPHRTTVRRVLSLLLGHDGIPLPDLRGLSAWIASLNPEARTILIRADPIAVAFGGDATDFTPGERRALFRHLENSPGLPLALPSSAALGALAGSRNGSALRELISSPIRTSARQMLVARLLGGLTWRFRAVSADHGSSPAADHQMGHRALLRIVRDDTWQDHVRCKALAPLDRLLADHPDRSPVLRDILSDIEAGRLRDDDNELLGTLLARMYPHDLPPAEIWDHLAPRPRPPGATSYSMFWSTLIDESDPEQIHQLLDSLCNRARDVISALADDGFGSIVLELLARGLELFGDKASASDLYRWFGLVDTAAARTGLGPAHYDGVSVSSLFSDAESRIRDWLDSHETVRRKLILQDLTSRESEIGERRFENPVGLKFITNDAPDDFREWCLSSAVRLVEERPIAAIELLRWATSARDGWGPPPADDYLARAVRDQPILRGWNDERLDALADWERRNVESTEQHDATVSVIRERRQEYTAAVREHAAELGDGRCRPALLNELAQVYFDEPNDDRASADPVARLRQRLDGDDALVRATLAGFRKLLSRDGLPSLTETARMHGRGQFSFFALPFLAGLAEEERAGHDPSQLLDEAGLLRALGYYLVSEQHVSLFAGRNIRDSSDDRDEPGLRRVIEAYLASTPRAPQSEGRARADGQGDEVGEPRWYRRTLSSNPEAVADALVAVHRAQVRKKAGPSRHVRDLSRDPAYASVAPLAVPRMFGAFPSRCTGPQVETLRVVLWAAVDSGNMPPAEFADVVRKRLLRRGMDVATRIQWLCAGLFVAREECLPELVDFSVDGRDVRIHHIVDFFVSPGNRFRGSLPFDDWKAEELADFLRALGQRSRRYEPPEGVGFLSDRQVAQLRAEPLLNRLIAALAERANDAAAAVLESLATDPALDGWSGELARARERQAERLRVAKHDTPGVASIQKTLQGGRPASAADLAALVRDTLEELAERIRDDSTNDWRQYWHRDPKTGRPVRPQHENDCRDALLSDLGLRLQPYGVDVQSEAQYADESQADIRVAFGSHVAVPVEIKRTLHRAVWRAADEQLAAKYTRAPESEGYGIYLVLWFGAEHMRVVPPCGRLPRTAAELKERLEEQLAVELQAKIGIVVIDVSPSGKYASAKS